MNDFLIWLTGASFGAFATAFLGAVTVVAKHTPTTKGDHV